MKKVIKILIILLIILIMMYSEYRFIMLNLHPYIEGNEIYIEFMDQIDVYE